MCFMVEGGYVQDSPSRWWFQMFFNFHPWGNDPVLTHIFQMGWFNHQLVVHRCSCKVPENKRGGVHNPFFIMGIMGSWWLLTLFSYGLTSWAIWGGTLRCPWFHESSFLVHCRYFGDETNLQNKTPENLAPEHGFTRGNLGDSYWKPLVFRVHVSFSWEDIVLF